MKLLFKQRLFSWFDSYDIYNEQGETVYTVKGQLSWGHCLKIYDAQGNYVGMVKERIFSFLPKFEIYEGAGEAYVGCIQKEFTFFKPKFNIDCNGWHVEGDWFEWDYNIMNYNGEQIATVSKQLFNWTDTYTIDVYRPEDVLHALMLVLALYVSKARNGVVKHGRHHITVKAKLYHYQDYGNREIDAVVELEDGRWRSFCYSDYSFKGISIRCISPRRRIACVDVLVYVN